MLIRRFTAVNFVVYLLVLLTFYLIPCVHSHGWLLLPHAYNQRFPTSDCEGAECTNACPNLEPPERMLNSPSKPTAVWERGQKVRVCYTRNNHHGGMARFSLVPINVMNSREYHEKLTLFHTCWDAGAVECKKVDIPCGTDPKTAFCREFEVPSVFPNGDYVLGYVWYGGLHFSRRHGWFPDFYSCSFVRIEGGGKPKCKPAHVPYFEPGDGRRVKNEKCHTSSYEIGTCDKRGCKSEPAFYSQPAPFKFDRKPPPVTCESVDAALEARSADINMLSGICVSEVCCHKSCDKCGGRKCDKEGQGSQCCISVILKSKRKCLNHPPPCIKP